MYNPESGKPIGKQVMTLAEQTSAITQALASKTADETEQLGNATADEAERISSEIAQMIANISAELVSSLEKLENPLDLIANPSSAAQISHWLPAHSEVDLVKEFEDVENLLRPSMDSYLGMHRTPSPRVSEAVQTVEQSGETPLLPIQQNSTGSESVDNPVEQIEQDEQMIVLMPCDPNIQDLFRLEELIQEFDEKLKSTARWFGSVSADEVHALALKRQNLWDRFQVLEGALRSAREADVEKAVSSFRGPRLSDIENDSPPPVLPCFLMRRAMVETALKKRDQCNKAMKAKYVSEKIEETRVSKETPPLKADGKPVIGPHGLTKAQAQTNREEYQRRLQMI